MHLSAGENKNDRLTAYDGTSITYDEIGNPITIGSATLEWEARQLKKYTPSIMDEYTYTYNADGIRTGKNLSGSVVQYVLDGSKIVSEQHDSSRIFIYLYDEAGSPIGIKYRAGNFAAGGTLGGELHVTAGGTATAGVTQFNIFDEIDKAYEKIMLEEAKKLKK